MEARPGTRTPNSALRAARSRLNLSQDDLAKALRTNGWTSCDRRTIQRYESGEVTRPRPFACRALTELFRVPLTELGFAGHEHEVDDVNRRQLLTLTTALAGLSAPAARAPVANPVAAEGVRHGLLRSALGPASEVAEWETIRDEYATRMLSTPPANLLHALLGDLDQLNDTLAGRDPASVAGLYEAGSVLVTLTAWTYGNLGAATEAGRWWRTAHHLARISDDRHTRLWVMAQEAVMALYQGTSELHVILAKVKQADDLAQTLPHTPGAAWLYCAKAQALGMLGEANAAERALRQVRDTFVGLDPTVTSDRHSFLGWAETRLHFTDSFTYAHLGDYPAASAAQDRALGAFPSGVVRDPVKIELQRALCLAKMGATGEAEHHATQQLARLEPSQHDLPIANLAARVVRLLPSARRSDESAHLRAYVRSRQSASAATS